MGFFKQWFKPREHRVTTTPAGLDFVAHAGQSVLEAALAAGLAFPHSCTVGTCGACKCRLTGGKIREISNFGYVLEAAELRSGVILACQAEARSDLTLEVPGLVARKLHPPADYQAELLDLTPLTHDIMQMRLQLDRPLRFDAGQYVTLEAPGIHGARAYSIANPPAPEGTQTLEFILRRVPEGAFTEALFAGAMTGQTLKLRGPMGNFWLRESRAPLVAVAGGSGLAPLLSMLRDAVRREVGRPCVLLFGARRESDLYALETIAALGRDWNGAFTFIPVLAEAPADAWTGARGLVTDALPAALAGVPHSDSEAYLCGPPGMVDAATERLLAHGLQPANIHCDKFLDGSHGLQRHASG